MSSSRSQTKRRGVDKPTPAILPSAKWLESQQTAVDLLTTVALTEGPTSAASDARQALRQMWRWTDQIDSAATYLSQGEESEIRIAYSETDYRSHKGEFAHHVAMLSKIVRFISPEIDLQPSNSSGMCSC